MGNIGKTKGRPHHINVLKGNIMEGLIEPTTPNLLMLELDLADNPPHGKRMNPAMTILRRQWTMLSSLARGSHGALPTPDPQHQHLREQCSTMMCPLILLKKPSHRNP